ncbi:MAG: ABC transporter substrate-binding protein [Desulfobacterales bacterium]|jgi:4-phytase/acid phosphatase/peptide/nickel transport system substrate-binding protein
MIAPTIKRQRVAASLFRQNVNLYFLTVLAVVMLLPRGAAAEPHYGGTLRMAHELDAAGFDAIKARAAIGAGGNAASLIMEKLFERGPQGELIPILGVAATPSADGKTWTVRLRENVTFHDGTPFNADAVVQHWQRLLNPENRYRGRIFLGPILSVEKTGPYVVRFNLKHPWIPFTAVLTGSRGFTSRIPSPNAVANDTQNQAPVGTGPYVFQEWKRGDRIVLAKNPSYWQKGIPYLERIVLRPISDHESRYAALVSGQVDMMVTDRPVHVNKLTVHPDFAAYKLERAGATVMAMNCTKPPLDDIRVRRAIAHAWDQKKYIRASFKNIVPRCEDWYGRQLNCGDVDYPRHDLEQARALIAAYGRPVEIEYIHSATPRGREAGVILQQMLKAIDVKVKAVPSDFPGIMKQLFSKQYDVCSWLIPDFEEMSLITMAAFHSKSPWNVYGFADPEVDRLLRKQRLSTDPQVRADTLCTIARKVNAGAPFLYLYGRTFYVFAQKRVKNITVPDHRMIPLADVWIEP